MVGSIIGAAASLAGTIFGGYQASKAMKKSRRLLEAQLRDNQNWCGAGKMLAVDAAGNFYPCTRFAGYSLRSKKPLIIGNVRDGIDQNKLRPFLTLDRTTQSPRECIECEVASGCAETGHPFCDEGEPEYPVCLSRHGTARRVEKGNRNHRP